jgi:uncharacterized short protein YbdD (DUF466 family)
MRGNGREQSGTGGNRGEASCWLVRLFPAVPGRSRLMPALRHMLGMPDYDSYCAHLRAHHPERPLPSAHEFFDQFVRARYGDGPTRCC